MSLFLLAFVQLRRAEPHTPRPFRMPGGRIALCVAVASPLLFILANLVILLLEPAHGARRTPACMHAYACRWAQLEPLHLYLAPSLHLHMHKCPCTSRQAPRVCFSCAA